jgi:hypothetical protein
LRLRVALAGRLCVEEDRTARVGRDVCAALLPRRPSPRQRPITAGLGTGAALAATRVIQAVQPKDVL